MHMDVIMVRRLFNRRGCLWRSRTIPTRTRSCPGIRWGLSQTCDSSPGRAKKHVFKSRAGEQYLLAGEKQTNKHTVTPKSQRRQLRYNCSVRNLRRGDVVFVKSNHIARFAEDVFPKIGTEIILVTHESPHSVPPLNPNARRWLFVSAKMIIRWLKCTKTSGNVYTCWTIHDSWLGSPKTLLFWATRSWFPSRLASETPTAAAPEISTWWRDIFGINVELLLLIQYEPKLETQILELCSNSPCVYTRVGPLRRNFFFQNAHSSGLCIDPCPSGRSPAPTPCQPWRNFLCGPMSVWLGGILLSTSVASPDECAFWKKKIASRGPP